jgi:hypothetical protein
MGWDPIVVVVVVVVVVVLRRGGGDGGEGGYERKRAACGLGVQARNHGAAKGPPRESQRMLPYCAAELCSV